MKIANHHGRAVLVLGDADRRHRRGLRRPVRSRSACASTTTGRRSSRSPAGVTTGTAPLVEAELALSRSRRRARCSRSDSTTAATPRSRAWRCPRCRRPSPSSRRRSGGRSTTSRSSATTVDWEVELVVVIGDAGRSRRRGRRVEPRRRAHDRPGHQRPAAAVRGRRAVLARQVAPRLRADGAVGGHARRGARPRRPRARLLGRRRDGAGRAHERPHLRRPAADRRAVGGAAAAARRRDLHRHARPASGSRAQPARFLAPGQVLETWIEGIGTIRNRCVDPTVTGGRLDVHAHFVPDAYRVAAEAAGHAQPDGFPALPEWDPDRHVEVMDRPRHRRGAALDLVARGALRRRRRSARTLAREVNEAGHRVVERFPTRFGQLASLPLPDVDGALAEIDHAVRRARRRRRVRAHERRRHVPRRSRARAGVRRARPSARARSCSTRRRRLLGGHVVGSPAPDGRVPLRHDARRREPRAQRHGRAVPGHRVRGARTRAPRCR